jgi:dTMP kinase
VREAYLQLAEAEPDRFLVLDARRSPDDLAADIRARVEELIGE